ncbi:NACHT domain-containing protein [Streptomyces microflavus]|uniref:NACHT domain-containing protein n=1 Tax=Streptomyces microflavus TaxID=1919 RepID=UPI00341A9790
MSITTTYPGDRTVAVFGSLQGSGVLLTDRLILTCAHVAGSGPAVVAHPAVRDRIPTTVAWIDDRLDVALLEAAEPVQRVAPVRLGMVDTTEAIPGCDITGFPRVQRYGPDQRLEMDQYTATALPMAGRVRNLLVCNLDGPPAAGPDDEPPALSGLSGGPLFAGDILLGIARQVPQQREGRRMECVPLGPVLAAEPFVQAYRRTGTLLREERVHGYFPRDLRYEAGYAQAVGAKYRHTKVIGLDDLSRQDSEWDLDTAYLSLEAQEQGRTQRGREASEPTPSLPQRIDTLLTDRPRVLLRGDAGAGKTTLLWWLAAHASAHTLDDDLAPLNGLVPFVVPLRTLRARGGTFPGPAELTSAAGLVVDAAPEGWAGRILESGRALLLVDGLDEVPPEDREQAHAWLSQFLARYPETRCVATVRPLAVEPDWLRSEGFAELRLLPMRNEDIQAFVASWHRAARFSEDDDAERLDELERDLSRQFDQNPTLRDLARTPLLCAVICALHRRRDGFLPETRWQLYRSALEMLLGQRDRRRRIGDPEGIDLSVEEHTQLLQRIAVWLVREGQSEFTREQALRQLGRALTGMERVSAQGPPAKILTHLLNRSGLLQERSDDTYQFIHRTFQDYLAAKEFVEDDHLNELLRHAEEETWQDVILLAAGHCGRHELAVLVGGLLDAGLKHEAGAMGRVDAHVLAALCAQHATWLDGGVRDRVRRSTAALFPLLDNDQVATAARLGAAALECLPEPDSMPPGDPLVDYTANLIARIGGGKAIAHAHAWVLAHPEASGPFARSWSNFPPREYATEVLAHCDLSTHPVTVSSRGQLQEVRYLPSLVDLTLFDDLLDSEIKAAMQGIEHLRNLFISENQRLADLSCLRSVSDSLAVLSLWECPGVQDVRVLAEFAALQALFLDIAYIPSAHWGQIEALPDGLQLLALEKLPADRLSLIPAHHGVTHLVLENVRPLNLHGLDKWTSLTSLEVSELSNFDEALVELRAHSQINDIALTAFPWNARASHGAQTVVPSVDKLTVQSPPDGRSLSLLHSLFPGTTHLTLLGSSHTGKLDLTPLHDWPKLSVNIRGQEHRVLVGAEELADRLTVGRY